MAHTHAIPTSLSAQEPQSASLPTRSPHHKTGACGMTITCMADTAFINFRGKKTLQQSLESCGFVAPPTPNSMTKKGKNRAIWLGPDETLLICGTNQEAKIHKNISQSFEKKHFAATIISDALRLYDLKGKYVRDMLAKGCSLDLHHTIFIKGQSAQTQIGHAQVILACENQHHIILICRTSFSDYMETWLKDASLEYGYEMV